MTARARGLQTCLLVAGAFLVSAVSAQSQPFSLGPVYANVTACIQTSRLRPEQCNNAFANAQAELAEAAPRFRSRDECAIYFRRCSIVSFSSAKDVTVQPAMEGVRLVSAGGSTGVLPVVTGKGPLPTFQPRPVDIRRIEQSAARRANAQATWEEQRKAASGPDASSGSGPQILAVPEATEPYDPNWAQQKGVATYPGPSARKKPVAVTQ
jgi:hypothetical protein